MEFLRLGTEMVERDCHTWYFGGGLSQVVVRPVLDDAFWFHKDNARIESLPAGGNQQCQFSEGRFAARTSRMEKCQQGGLVRVPKICRIMGPVTCRCTGFLRPKLIAQHGIRPYAQASEPQDGNDYNVYRKFENHEFT